MNVDDFIASQFPVLPVPADGAVKAAGQGVRYHAARNGLWREINLPWMRSLMPVATCDGIQVPYGLPTASVELALPVPDKSLWRDFVLQAKAAMPNEGAAILPGTRQPSSGALRHAGRSKPIRVSSSTKNPPSMKTKSRSWICTAMRCTRPTSRKPTIPTTVAASS